MFKWKDEYSVNVEEIDNQHKNLFILGEKIYELVSIEDNYDHYDEIMTALDNLMEYTVYHFESEEKLMREYGYKKEDYEKQEIEHKVFISKIKKMYDKDIDNNQKTVMVDLLNFIINWIESHILRTDKLYMKFFNQNGLY